MACMPAERALCASCGTHAIGSPSLVYSYPELLPYTILISYLSQMFFLSSTTTQSVGPSKDTHRNSLGEVGGQNLLMIPR